MNSSDQPLVANQLPISVEFPADNNEFINTISLLYKRIANAVNTKEGSLYLLQEIANFQLYFTTNDPFTLRNVYRKTFDMVNLNGGPIAAGATASFAHGIAINGNPTIVACTRIFGTATTSNAPVRYVPLPYVSQVVAENIQIYLTPTNVVLVNGNSILTQVYITTEYLKN